MGLPRKSIFSPVTGERECGEGENRGRGGMPPMSPGGGGNLQPTALFDQLMAFFVLHSPTFLVVVGGEAGEKRGL